MISSRPGVIAALLCGAAALPALAQQPTTGGPTVRNALLEAVLDSAEWRSIGPANMMGRVTDVEGIPSPSRTFFFASAAGGIWKTTNGGITFRPLFQNERVVSMGDLAIAPSDTMQIWAGTGEEDSRNSISPGAGVYKSTDGGLTWKLMGLEKTEHISRIIVHPTNPNIVWVAALGAAWRHNPERGLYKTTDGGQTWQLKKFVSDKAGFIDLIIHPRNPNVLFAASWERLRTPYSLFSGGPGSALWRSDDGGETWTEVKGGGFPATLKGRIGLDIARSNPDVVYALVEAASPDGHDPNDRNRGCRAAKAGGCGLYRSEDGGRSWTWMAGQNVRPFYYSQVRVDPSDPNRVYWSSTPVNFSTDGGRTVRTTTVGLHVDHHAMWIDPFDPNRIIVGNDGGVGISFDRGGNWWFPNSVALGQFYNISHDMAVPYNVCGGLQDNGSWCGPSRRPGGAITNMMWATVSGGDGFVTAQDPRDRCIVYSESQGGNMGRRNVCTGENLGVGRPSFQPRYRMWSDSIAIAQPDPTVRPSGDVQRRLTRYRANQVRDSLEDQFRYNWNTPFFLSPHNPDVFYAGSNRVLKSTERGMNMRAISPDLSKKDSVKMRIATQITGGVTADVTGAETYGTIVSLNESPRRAGMLAAGTDDGNVWVTTNDGGTWTDLTPKFRGLVPDTTYVSRIEFSPHEANRFYVTFDNHRRGDFKPYVFVTRDGGSTFTSIASNLPTGGPDFVHVVREDPVNPNLLYLGTDVGLYVSVDQGGNWRKWSGRRFPTVPVHDLRVHPRDRELIVGTHGRSIWVVDVAALQQLTPQVLAANAPVVLEGGPGLQFGGPPIGGESSGHSVFRGDNRASDAEIIYYLPTAASGQARFVIRNARGDTVQAVTGPSSAGLHRVSWNMRSRATPQQRVLTVSERRDSLATMKRADVVADSLIRVARTRGGLEPTPGGEPTVVDTANIRRVAAVLKGGDPQALVGAIGFGGGGGRGGGGGGGGRGGGAGPTGWVDRPGEGAAGGGGGGGRGGQPGEAVQQLQVIVQAFRAAGVPGVPGAQIPGGGFGGGGGGGGGFGGGGAGAGALVDAGTYNVTATIGGQTYTTKVTVVK